MRMIRTSDTEAVSTPITVGSHSSAPTACPHEKYMEFEVLPADQSPKGVKVTLERCAKCSLAVRSRMVAETAEDLERALNPARLPGT